MNTDQSTSPALCPGGSVGAVIKKDGQYLLLFRKSFPPGLAGIAGHLDPGETPEQALVRELREEAGIEVDTFQILWHGVVPTPCKRGFASHEWWVYDVTAWHGEPVNQEPEKHAFLKWLSTEEIRAYLKTPDVDPAWAILFPKLI